MQEIAAGNNDLSARTEAEASLLQGLGTSLSQLKGKRPQEMRANAGEAATLLPALARRGDATTEILVPCANGWIRRARVRARSPRSSGMIDSVAHQTNLLALNAAVEAATRG